MKKKINILLILALSVIWGVIIYRLVSRFFVKHELAQNFKEFVRGPSDSLFEAREDFVLAPLSRDPFLGVTTESRRVPTKERKARMPKHQISKIVRSWPSIKYFGVINSGNRDVALLSIDGKLLKIRKGDNSQMIAIKKIFPDSIKLRYSGEEKIFKQDR